MKLILVASIFLVIYEIQYVDSKLLDEVAECAKEMGVCPDELKNLVTNKDQRLNCINACVMNKVGAMAKGKLSESNLMKFVQDSSYVSDLAKENFKTCHDQVIAGKQAECQSVKKIVDCMADLMSA